jgi:sialate O-acetylesterase
MRISFFGLLGVILCFSIALQTEAEAKDPPGCLVSVLKLTPVREETKDTARLQFADPLQNNMVIQQNKPFKVWGKAKAGHAVEIQADWLTGPVTVKADSAGNFIGIINVPKIKKGDYTAHTLWIRSGKEIRKLKNLLIGDVWFLSGQSNMQFDMKGVLNAEAEVAAADYPHIRLLNVALNFSATPVNAIKGVWQECTPASVKGFSAVGYYFGRAIHNKLDIPIGLIFSGIGAAAAQAYVPQSVLAADPLLDSVYLEPYLRSAKSRERITPAFTFEKVTRPFLLYNALINPFVNLSIKGICWYQGASNRQERNSYTRLMYAMIKSWRKNFSQGNLPFYYVQVAPFFYGNPDSVLDDYAYFREAQEKISRLNNTAMVVTMDVGEAKNLHPKDKEPVGERLARTALNRTYGFLDVAYRGPHFQSVRFVKDTAIVSFDPASVTGGLRTNDGGAPRYFFVAGRDRVFHQGKAVIYHNKIYITSAAVKEPVAVRYAFTNFPVTHLENGEGLPAVPFRSDKWPETRQSAK